MPSSIAPLATMLDKVSDRRLTWSRSAGWTAAAQPSTPEEAGAKLEADHQGLKIRMMGNQLFVDTKECDGAATASRWPTARSSEPCRPELIDGAENELPRAFLHGQPLQRPAPKYYTQTNHLIIPRSCRVSEKVTWDELSADDQAVVKGIGPRGTVWSSATSLERECWRVHRKLKAASSSSSPIDNKLFYDATGPICGQVRCASMPT